jgi:GrpB-like predicted nucleotidyltransferase (UPF0157 family)
VTETFRLVPAQTAAAHAAAAFERWRLDIAALLPESVDIQHVGATAVPGCLTKGDLDMCVRVDRADFVAADAALAARFARNDGSIRTDAFSAFAADEADPPLGVQLVVRGGELDVFVRFRDALRADPALVADYNGLKAGFDGRPMDAYRAAKAAFVEQVLADTVSGL